MRPVLFELGGFAVPSYFFMLAMGLSAGILLAVREAHDEGIPPERVATLAQVVVLSALVGARLMYVFETWPRLRSDPLLIPQFWTGGLSFFGGFGGALLCGSAYLVRARLPLMRMCDLGVVAVTLGHVFGRTGCLLNGCCHGRVVRAGEFLPFAGPDRDGLVRHPTQAYEILGLLVLFLGLYYVRKRVRPRLGMVFGLYLVGYGVLRFLLEPLREQAAIRAMPGLLLYQWVSVAYVVGGACALVWARRRADTLAGVDEAGEPAGR